MSEAFTTYGIGPDKYADELQALRDERDRLREALEQIAKWDKRSQSETVQQFAKAALTPAGGG